MKRSMIWADSHPFRWSLLWFVSSFLLAACDPEPERPSYVPQEAELENRVKSGWIWALCLDSDSGSAQFNWVATGAGPHIVLNSVKCSEANSALARTFLQLEGQASRIDFLLPEAPGAFDSMIVDGPCPQNVAESDLRAFARTLLAAETSGKLTPEAIADVRGVLTKIEQHNPERLWFGGAFGNNLTGRVRCSDISDIMPETNPAFPEHLKTGQ